jgi:hypothetical protein
VCVELCAYDPTEGGREELTTKSFQNKSVPIKDYARANNLSASQVVQMLREGKLVGKLRDGRWYVEIEEEAFEKIGTRTPVIAIIALTVGIAACAGISLSWIATNTRLQRISALQKQAEGLERKTSILKDRVDSQESEIRDLKISQAFSNLDGTVDLTDPTVQEIGGKGFLVANLDMKKHLTGIKLEGRVVNTQSVRHENATFKLIIGDRSQEFTIDRISSGNSTGFSVYVPDISVEDTRYARMYFVNSTVQFHTK